MYTKSSIVGSHRLGGKQVHAVPYSAFWQRRPPRSSASFNIMRDCKVPKVKVKDQILRILGWR